MTIKYLIVLLSSFLIASTGLLEARYKMGQKKPVKVRKQTNQFNNSSRQAPTHPSATVANESAILNSLSQRFDIDVEKLEYLRSLHHGYQELIPALIVAREAQVEVGRILAMRNSNEPWKSIAKTHYIELKPLNKEVLSLLKPIQKALPKKLITERPKFRNNAK